MSAALLVMLLLDRGVGDLQLSVPTFFGAGANVVLIRTYLPLIWAAAIADAFASRGLSVEARPMPLNGVRFSRLGLCDAALFAIASCVASGMFAAVGRGGVSGLGPVLTISGVACIGTLRAGPAIGSFGCTALMLVTSVYPHSAPGSQLVHVLQPDGNHAWSTAAGIALSLAAVCLLTADSALTTFRRAEASPV